MTANNKTLQAVRDICTPSHHAAASKNKPIKLLALGTGPHGKTATFEFEEGWQRTLDFLIEADAWHPLFADVPHTERFDLIDHAKAPFIRHADGTKSRPDPLSFTRVIKSERGRHIRSTYFDVPEQSYEEGGITGLKCAAELLEELARGYGPHLMVHHIVKAAVMASNNNFSGVSQNGAASAFLGIVQMALKFFAEHANHRPHIANQIVRAEKYRDECAQNDLLEKHQFIDRMKAAKEAKRGLRVNVSNEPEIRPA